MTAKQLHLQGLRTVAIIFVVLFHFFPSQFPNGYLGVDQFFLLSGYLMTMMLDRKPNLTFSSVADFFYRRVKRIVPMYYLAVFFILVLVNAIPQTAIMTNFESAIYAIFFATNLIRPTGLEDYEAKLGLGVDMFTHTWSLSVEMQFYFLFPIIFYILQLMNNGYRNVFTSILVAMSFVFHAYTDSFLSFYCVFSRIWQFLAGMIIFYQSADSKSGEEETKALLDDEGEASEADKSLMQLVTYVCLAASVALLICVSEFSPLMGRINIILLTALIVHAGENCWLLENWIVVFIGEISYSWYLLHWPVVAFLKMKEWTNMLVGMIMSLILSVVLYFAFEKHYRSWERITILKVVLVFLVIIGGSLYQIYGKIPNDGGIVEQHAADLEDLSNKTSNEFIFDSDSVNVMIYGYENRTNEERAKMNEWMDANDGRQTGTYPCIQKLGTDDRSYRCKVSENEDAKSNRTLLVMGNSYVGNALSTINDACNGAFRLIFSAWTACEPLLRGHRINGKNCFFDSFFMDAVKEHKPDVLFMMTRLMDTQDILNGTNPFNDNNFKSMTEKLKEIEKYVSKKIYILDAFTWPKITLSQTLNKYLREGVKFKDSDLVDWEHRYWFFVGKKRMARLVQGCKKCELFDYENQFFVNGRYQMYDPKYYVAYFTRPLHVSPVGLARIKPLFHHMCYNY